MKRRKIVAVILAAIMTASSVSITSFADNYIDDIPQNDVIDDITNNDDEYDDQDDIYDYEDESCDDEVFGNEKADMLSNDAFDPIEDIDTLTLSGVSEITIGSDEYDTLDEAMNSLQARSGNITIELKGTVTYEFAAWEGFTKNYSDGTITFVGMDDERATVLNLHGTDSDHTQISNAKKLIFKNLTINKTNVGDDGSKAWNRHALNFGGGVDFEDVTVNTEVAVGAGSSFKNVDFNEANEQYCLWIKAQTSEEIIVDNCTFTATNNGRGIKIADQYTHDLETNTDSSKKVKLVVKNSIFNTAKKAAVLVSNVKGANITAYNNDISNVDADSSYLVWVDDGKNEIGTSYADYAVEVLVNDEVGSIVPAKIESGEIVKTPATYDWYTEASDDEYVIETVNDWLGFARITSGKAGDIAIDYFSGKTVTLGADLDFDSVDFLYSNSDGDITSDYRVYYFYGTLDGCGHKIKNVKYKIEDQTSSYGIGLIRNAYAATFKNITIDGITVSSDSAINFGGLTVMSSKGACGCQFENINVKNVNIDIDKTTGYNGYIGGISGFLKDYSSIVDCSVENFDFDAENGIVYFGGLVGWFYIDSSTPRFGEVTNCTVKNLVVDAKMAGGRAATGGGNFGGIGGLLGYGHDGNNYNLPIKNCHVTGLDMTLGEGYDECYVGGAIGMSRRKYSAEDCTVEGKITAGIAEGQSRFYVGGFVGGAPGADVNTFTYPAFSYKNCTADVDITVTEKTTAGGFAGISGASWGENSGYNVNRDVEYINCKAFGTIVADEIAGGFAGIADRGNFNSCDASETTVSGSVAGGFIGDADVAVSGSNYKITVNGSSGSNSTSAFFGEADGTVTINGGNVSINDTDYYFSFADAIANASDGDTIKLLADAAGKGIVIDEGTFNDSGITIDLNNFTYTVNDNLVGSEGSQTNAFQFKKDNKITIKNGTLASSADVERINCTNTGKGAFVLIMNYADLTLDDVTLDGTKLAEHPDRSGMPITLSNNNGVVSINKSTINASSKTTKGYAFDVYNSSPAYGNVTVTVSTDSVIDGFVNIGGNSDDNTTLASLKIADHTYTENGDYYKVESEFIKTGKRSIDIEVDKTIVYAGDTIELTVTLSGKSIANAVYDVIYDPDMFELISASTHTSPVDGKISEMLYFTDGSCFDDGEELATYTFKTLAQSVDNVSTAFKISNTAASTYLESIAATAVNTSNNDKVDVTIKLKEYEIEVNLDDTVIDTETETSKTVRYTNEGHNFTVTSTPLAEVKYKVNGEDKESVNIKDRGEYTIEYTVIPQLGYKEITGTFTVTISEPDYIVEVNLTNNEDADYVANKKIVIVYTNTDDIAFKYNGNLMIDVTESGYRYNGESYSHVFAFVTDAITGAGSVDDYKNNITCIIPSPSEVIKITYTTDINFDGRLTVWDISTIYGIYNGIDDYFTDVEFQKKILRADLDSNKVVNNDDATMVVNAVKGN